MPRRKQESTGSSEAQTKSEPEGAPEKDTGPELTLETLDRLAKAWDDTAKYYEPLFIEVVDIGAPGGESPHIREISQILREASDRIFALVGYDKSEGRDLGRYGMVYDSRDGLPPEMRVAYDCIAKAHGDALAKWQREAVRWRARQAVFAEAAKIRSEWGAAQAPPEAAAEKASKPKRRPRRRKAQEGNS